MLKKDCYDIAVIGGGASGFAAAVTSSEGGAKCIILEGNTRVLKKLAVTGNGQGNIANVRVKPCNYNSGFAEKVYEKIPYSTLENFFLRSGIITVVKENGRVYPLSLQASAVVDNLRMRAAETGIEELCGFCVSGLEKKNGVFVITSDSGETVRAKAVIVACGGVASSHLSCGGGYSLLTDIGHSLKKPLPSLVQLKTLRQPIRFLKGVRLENVAVKAISNGKTLKESTGDAIFTDYGVSGLAIFEISGAVVKAIDGGKKATLVIDILPYTDEYKLKEILIDRKKVLSKRGAEHFLTGLIAKQVAKSVLEISNIKTDKVCGCITDEEAARLAHTIKSFSLEVTGSLGLDMAQVTSGGIELKDFDENLMSKKCSGLFACGEILDIDGDCGGYNLMWAFSSGILCGKECSRYIKNI